jgi:cardiolipin synthase
MSVVRVAVPVLEGRRRFHYDKGRPWTVLEHLLLAALAERAFSAGELSELGNLPHRVVVEGLIRLMRAGWVEMLQGAEGVSFRITKTGLDAVAADALPSASRRLSRRMNFVVDQVTGSVFRTRELPYLHRHHVEERALREPVVWIEKPPAPIYEQVRALVDALFFDDEKFVGMDPAGERLAERWALITVKDGFVEGLPNRAPPELAMAIVKAARRAPARPTAGVVVTSTAAPAIADAAVPQPHRMLFSANDLILGGTEHREALINIVRRARHRVIIHSTFIGEDKFKAMMPAFRQAMQQGALIDVFWGQNEDAKGARSTREAVDRLKRYLSAERVDRLRLHAFSTGSHAKFVLADDGSPLRFVSVVGSCNWLSSGFESFEASVRLRDPAIIADILDQLAELSRGASGVWNKLTSELVALAAQQKSRPAGPAGRAEVTVILGARHAEVIRQARDEATKRIFVASHRWSRAGDNVTLAPVLAAAEAKQISVTAYYGVPSGGLTGENAAAATQDAARRGVVIRPVHKPRLHAKLLAWDDDTALITSQNLLSADPPESKPRQEFGILVRATGVARTLVDRFNAARID